VQTDAKPVHHFLLEIWVEAREISGADPIVRARARDLDSGRQRYVKYAAELEAFIAQSLAEEGVELSAWRGGSE